MGKNFFRWVWVFGLCFCGCATGDCPQFEAGVSLGTVESALVDEASGMVASRRHEGVLWVNNDSGDSARIYAMAEDGRHLGVYNLLGAVARDWEDIAIGPSGVEGQDYIYVGDIGDNDGRYASIVVYRVAEPTVDVEQSPVTVDLAPVGSTTLLYPDGARDAETLLVDPLSGDLYVVSKREFFSRVYRAAGLTFGGETVTMEYMCSLPWGWATGGDVSPDGSEVIVRGYVGASLWRRAEGDELWEAFGQAACGLSLMTERQGESICFDAAGCGYLTTSEYEHRPIYYFGRVHEGDVDGDCAVNGADFNTFAGCWLGDGSGECATANMDGANGVDLVDLAVLARAWLSAD